MADPVLALAGAAHAMQTWAAPAVMPTIEDLVARGGEVARAEERPRTAALLARATHELVFRCYEAANQVVAANKAAGFTKNSMTAYLLADSLGVPFVKTASAKPHEAALAVEVIRKSAPTAAGGVKCGHCCRVAVANQATLVWTVPLRFWQTKS